MALTLCGARQPDNTPPPAPAPRACAVDGLYDRLRALQGYVEDTEDLVAMQLDNARNSLVRVRRVGGWVWRWRRGGVLR